ncbi:hypothetical protein KUCAC02_023301, partial [Chaenocephalus aceratus]
ALLWPSCLSALWPELQRKTLRAPGIQTALLEVPPSPQPSSISLSLTHTHNLPAKPEPPTVALLLIRPHASSALSAAKQDHNMGLSLPQQQALHYYSLAWLTPGLPAVHRHRKSHFGSQTDGPNTRKWHGTATPLLQVLGGCEICLPPSTENIPPLLHLTLKKCNIRVWAALRVLYKKLDVLILG